LQGLTRGFAKILKVSYPLILILQGFRGPLVKRIDILGVREGFLTFRGPQSIKVKNPWSRTGIHKSVDLAFQIESLLDTFGLVAVCCAWPYLDVMYINMYIKYL